MDHLLNWEELGVFLSLCGLVCWVIALRVRHSQPWQESAALKRGLLVIAGILLQVPVVLVVVFEPPYVTGLYAVEGFDPCRLLLNYGVQGTCFIGVAVLGRMLE
jgi:hypothetical protein